MDGSAPNVTQLQGRRRDKFFGDKLRGVGYVGAGWSKFVISHSQAQ